MEIANKQNAHLIFRESQSKKIYRLNCDFCKNSDNSNTNHEDTYTNAL